MLEYRQVYLQSGKWIVVLILPFWQPFQDHTWGLTCASLQCKWLYSMCKEVEYIPPESWPNSYHISAFIRLDNALWFHSVAVEIAVSTKRRKKRRRRRKERKKGFREMWCLSYLPWCLLCQYVDPVFLCTQTCYDGLGFVLSTQQMICDGGCLRALNMQLKHVWYHCFSISLYNCVITFCLDCLWIFIYLPEIWYIAEFIFHF